MFSVPLDSFWACVPCCGGRSDDFAHVFSCTVWVSSKPFASVMRRVVSRAEELQVSNIVVPFVPVRVVDVVLFWDWPVVVLPNSSV
jgi:hypothetical protein